MWLVHCDVALLPKCVCLVLRLSSRLWVRSLSEWWVSLIERKQYRLGWGLTVNHGHVKVLSGGNHYLLFHRDSWAILHLCPSQFSVASQHLREIYIIYIIALPGIHPSVSHWLVPFTCVQEIRASYSLCGPVLFNSQNGCKGSTRKTWNRTSLEFATRITSVINIFGRVSKPYGIMFP